MTDELVHYAVHWAIATVTLDSPANRNALSARLTGELGEHLRAAAADPGVRAVVITHTGRTFCAGADLREQAAGNGGPPGNEIGGTPSTEAVGAGGVAAGGGPAGATRRLLGLLRAIAELPKPVIARVDGHVRAGGLGLIGACDIALAGDAATFAFTEVRLGLAPAIISLTTLGRMSERSAARYYLTGETFGAPAAAASGLITAAPGDTAALDAELDAVCDALRACSPQGLAETKPLTARAALAAFAQRAEEMQALSQRLFSSDEAQEGMTAFLQKRPPAWAPPQ